jgi:hypothetical protein
LRCVDTGIEYPEFLAGHRIKRNDAVERRAQHQLVIGDDRGDLELGPFDSLAAPCHLAGTIGPGDLQQPDISVGDLSDRRISGVTDIASDRLPVEVVGDRGWRARVPVYAVLRRAELQ